MMAPSKTTMEESAQNQQSSSNCGNLNLVLRDPTSFPVPKINFMQQLSTEYTKHKAAMEVSKKSYRDKKDVLKQAEWQAQSKSNELDEEIKKLQIEYDSLVKSEAQKVEAIKQEIEKETNISEEMIQERKRDAVHVTILKKLYKNFPGAPENLD